LEERIENKERMSKTKRNLSLGRCQRYGVNPCIRKMGLAQPPWSKSQVHGWATPASSSAEDAWHVGVASSSSFGRCSL